MIKVMILFIMTMNVAVGQEATLPAIEDYLDINSVTEWSDVELQWEAERLTIMSGYNLIINYRKNVVYSECIKRGIVNSYYSFYTSLEKQGYLADTFREFFSKLKEEDRRKKFYLYMFENGFIDSARYNSFEKFDAEFPYTSPSWLDNETRIDDPGVQWVD